MTAEWADVLVGALSFAAASIAAYLLWLQVERQRKLQVDLEGQRRDKARFLSQPALSELYSKIDLMIKSICQVISDKKHVVDSTVFSLPSWELERVAEMMIDMDQFERTCLARTLRSLQVANARFERGDLGSWSKHSLLTTLPSILSARAHISGLFPFARMESSTAEFDARSLGNYEVTLILFGLNMGEHPKERELLRTLVHKEHLAYSRPAPWYYRMTN